MSARVPTVAHSTPLWVVSELVGATDAGAVVVTMGDEVVGVVDAREVVSQLAVKPCRAIAALPMRRTELVEAGQPLSDAMKHLALGHCDAVLVCAPGSSEWRLLLPD